MTNLHTYWLVGPDDSKALVEGAAQRDEYLPHGWAETTDPIGDEKVWCQHDVTGGRAKFPAAVVDAWAAKGWAPSAPPPIVDPLATPSGVPVPAAASLEGAAPPVDQPEPVSPGRTSKTRTDSKES